MKKYLSFSFKKLNIFIVLGIYGLPFSSVDGGICAYAHNQLYAVPFTATEQLLLFFAHN